MAIFNSYVKLPEGTIVMNYAHAIFQQNSEYVPCRAFRKNIKKLASVEKKRYHTQPHSHCP